MGLECTSRGLISFLGSSYYIAFGVGIIFMTIPDKKGRRSPLIWVLFAHTLGFSLALFSHNIYTKIAGFMVMGVMHIKNSLAVVTLFESICPGNKCRAITIANGFDVSTMGISCLYYYTISNDYFGI